jgi:malate synthase
MPRTRTLAYRNWLGLMKGDLKKPASNKGGKTVTRKLPATAAYTGAGRQASPLKGRALMLVRNVGHLMTNPAIRDATATRSPRG